MLHLVLVHPEIPQNTGNVARTCAVTGARLHLVKPMGFALDDARMRRAGLDYWPSLRVRVHESLEEYLLEAADAPIFLATTKAKRSFSSVVYPDGCHILFGSETSGLPASVHEAFPDREVRIPQLPGARCLNLSNAVAVFAYEALRQLDYPGLQ